MTPPCVRETDVAIAASAGQWPSGASAQLRAHVLACARCRETAAVVSAAQSAPIIGANVPTAAEMWWRLAVRARVEREQAAARPVVWLQGLAGACGVGLALTALGRSWPAAERAIAAAWVRIEQVMPAVPPAVQPATDPLMALVLSASGALAVATVVAAAFVWLVDD